MRHAQIGTMVLALTVLGPIQSANADVPPPDDYVETCTIELQQQEGESCILCPVTFEDFDTCIRGCGAIGYTKRCQTWGASAYKEVLCRSATAPSPGECTLVSTAQALTDEAGGEPGSAGDPGVGNPTGGTGATGAGGTAGRGPAVCQCIEDTAAPGEPPDQPACSCSTPGRTTSTGALAALALGLCRRRAGRRGCRVDLSRPN